MTTRSGLTQFCALAVALALCGCGGAEYPDTVPVEGTVLYKGKPVEGANVSFDTTGAPRAAYGVTDSEGKFVLSTFGTRDGAIPGKHKVTVSKPGQQSGATDTTQPPKPEDLMKSYQETRKNKPQNDLPAKYADPNKSPLAFEVVKDAPNNFTIELTD